MATPPAVKGALFPTKPRRKCLRSKEGCLNCRSKRKKCDEVKPTCADCSRTDQECIWPGTNSSTETELNTHVGTNPKGRQLSEADDRLSVLEAYLEGLSISPGTLGSVPDMPAVQSAAAPSSQVHAPSSHLADPQPVLSHGSLSNLNDVSRQLYRQYCDVTANTLARGPSIDGNPFLTYILPLAESDPLIMDTILALGGAHLSVNTPSASRLEVATRSHYASVLEGLRLLLAGPAPAEMSRMETLRLLIMLLLLCLFEGVHGATHGAVYHHLRASRTYALVIASDIHESPDDGLHHLRGFVLELYAYLALNLAVTPRGPLHDTPVDLDPFLESLEFLRRYKTRGFIMGFGQRVFEAIPAVARLVEKRRLLEDAEEGKLSKLNDSPESLALDVKYKDLLTRLYNIDASLDNFDDLRPRKEREAATTVYQNALILYLHSAFNIDMLGNADLMTSVETMIPQSAASFLFLFCSDSPFRRMLLWPAMITASCARRKQQRDGFRMALGVKEQTPGAVKEAARLIEMLWKDPDPRAFGPRGLTFVMKKHGLSFSMC